MALREFDEENDMLPFEALVSKQRKLIREMEQLANSQGAPEQKALLTPFREQSERYEKEFYENLSPWNTVEIARHPKRPMTRDFVALCFDTFEELHGDRKFGDDMAIVTGIGQLGKHRVMLVGQHRGRTVTERHASNAGCTHPEGYWKSLAKMKLAEKFGLPVICLIDTKGAYPGIGSEERGVAMAIAENLREMSLLNVPIICCVIGEGGSGGALGLAVGDRILMLQHAWYSVISPEGCASILWRDGEKKDQAAEILKLTSRDLFARGFIDEVVQEPLGGGHRAPEVIAKTLRDVLIRNLDELIEQDVETLIAARYEKFRAFGEWLEDEITPPTEEAAAEDDDENDTVRSDETPIDVEKVEDEA